MPNYIKSTPCYNERRYGRPWMAIIGTSMTKNFTFLDWNGRNGCAGEFAFSADAGTIVAYGQKDHRKGRGGVDGYQICMPDGTLPILTDSQVLALLKLPVGERCEAFRPTAPPTHGVDAEDFLGGIA